uniref:Uncharacterized protein LOC100176418 n=1 Tax=Phallusia mammillata TaxID=59560 RepID=A0A6F9DGI4_9ASCI|nr:uncharacterized protein LOC100176418 [Phallusia mammillata]
MADSSPQHMLAPDSETSIDYYVTTLKDQAPSQKIEFEKVSKVISVDRAGSVKVRKRKKSKRRRKKMNTDFKDRPFFTSDEDSRIRSGSDGSTHKLPKRSASLCERDLHVNVKFNSEEDYTKASATQDRSIVRRRTKKKNSFKVNRRGVFLDFNGTENVPTNVQRSESLNYPNLGVQQPKPLTENVEGERKFDSQKNALATLNAFMEEVEEATSVAKQQEKKVKDANIRRSRSLSDLQEDSSHVEVDAGDSLSHNNTKLPPFVHKKSDSFGQSSLVSASVFLSEPDIFHDDNKAIVVPSSSVESGNERKPKLLHDLVMATDVQTLTELMFKKVTEKNQRKQKPLNTKSQQDADYGLAHLEHVCKLMEQIANLRNENQALKQKVSMLEGRLAVYGETGTNGISSSPFPRSKHVVRLQDAKFNGFRRNSSMIEKNTSQPQLTLKGTSTVSLGNTNPLSSNGFGTIPSDRPVIYSNVSLKKNKRRPYSRDDLELSSKGRWKFWRAPVTKVDNSNTKRQIVSSIKSQHTQGSAVHLKSASVTLDTLLNNIDNDFSQKMLQWQATNRTSRAPSRASMTSTENVVRTLPSNMHKTTTSISDDNSKTNDSIKASGSDEIHSKESFKKKMSRWEKAAARKLSWHGDYRRSKSMERIDDSSGQLEKGFVQQNKMVKDFYKSMPCVMIDGKENLDLKIEAPNVNGNPSLTEWSALQEAFPTKSSVGDPIRRLISTSQSRLASPLRKKSNKRRSWSFTKRPSSKYFLPTSGEFVSMGNLGKIGDEYMLELDQEDVKSTGVNDEELQYLKKNTADLREKLQGMEKAHVSENVQDSSHKVNRRPASTIARLNHERSALSFRRSRISGIPLQSSYNRGSVSMSPLEEEPNATASLPDINPTNSGDHYQNRRHTVSILNCSPAAKQKENKPTETEEAFSQDKDELVTPVVSYVTQKVSTLRKNQLQGQGVIKAGSTSTLDEHIASSTESMPRKLKETQKSTPKKGIGGKLLSQIGRFSTKTRLNKRQKNANDSNESEDTTCSGDRTPKKRKPLFKSFSAKSKQPSVTITTVDDPPNPVTKIRQSQKIADISKRLSVDSVRSRTSSNQSNGPKLKSGLVSRLSRRFNRGDVKVKPPTNSNTKSSLGQDNKKLNISNNNNNYIPCQLCVYVV